MKIRRNHIGNLRISPGGLLLDKENNGLPSFRHLNGPQRNAFRNHFSTGRRRNLRTLQPNPHPVGLLRHAIRALLKDLLCRLRKPIALRTWRDAQYLSRLQLFQRPRRQPSLANCASASSGTGILACSFLFIPVRQPNSKDVAFLQRPPFMPAQAAQNVRRRAVQKKLNFDPAPNAQITPRPRSRRPKSKHLL